MICANPDREAIRAGVRGISAGAIAEAFQDQHAGEVRFHGKPHPEIYARARSRTGAAPDRILAIGDGLATDIRGANRAGLPSVLIAGGIHAVDLAARGSAGQLESLCAEYGCRPDAALQTLRW